MLSVVDITVTQLNTALEWSLIDELPVLQDPALMSVKDMDSRNCNNEKWKGRACEHQDRQEMYEQR